MLATAQAHAFSGPEWLFEIKYDGVRILAERSGDSLALYGRNQTAISNRYPELIDALKYLPATRFVIDGEIVALDQTGKPSFQRLQARMHLTHPRDIAAAVAKVPVQAFFFDCLALDGYDLRGLPLLERKEVLRSLLPAAGLAHYGDHVMTSGTDLFGAAWNMGLEGIVAKKCSSRYTGGRSREWLKIKCHRGQEFIIGGYTKPQGERAYFGALHLGVYQGEKLVYVSKVGTGFDSSSLRAIWERMQPLRRARSPFVARSPAGRGHTWIEPKLVCEVRFSDWTDDGGIRHPSFLGLRTDKNPEDCLREQPQVVTVRDVAPVVPEDGAARKKEVF